jgi:uncharacterized protein (TIRG00374 family)
MSGDRITTVVGFLAAVAVLGVVLWFVGIDEVLAALAGASTRVLVLVLLVAVVWLSAWGLALWTVLKAVGAPIHPAKAVFLFTAAVFSNNITPFGQAGGEPVSALLISTAADSEYETGLAAIASVDTLHFVPSIGFSIIGFVYIVAGTADLTRNVVVAALGVVVLVTLILTAATLGWRYRSRLETWLVRVVLPVTRSLARIIPNRSPPPREAIEHRIDGFFEAVGRVADNRRTLLTAMGFSALGWLALSTSLWLSLLALGHTVPFTATLFIVPVGGIAGFTPLPGGLGGLEAVLIALLVPAAGVPSAVAGAAVLVHRGATYWLPMLLGGGVAAALGTQSRA